MNFGDVVKRRTATRKFKDEQVDKEIAELREKYDLHMKVEKYIRQEDNLNDKKYIKE